MTDARARFGRGIGVEHHVAAEEARGVDIPEDDERVRDGRVGATAPVTRGSRLGAGRMRPDAHHSARVDPRDGAAARADRLDVDERQRGPHPHELTPAAARRLSVLWFPTRAT